MSRTKIMTPTQIRVELARRKMTRVDLALHIGVTHDYVCKIINGKRKAEDRRRQIAEYFMENNKNNKNMRGIS